jgi:hypothetical protein
MRSALLFVAVSLATVARGEQWTPPKNPSPDLILQEARADARAKRYEAALAKHVWFHEQSLKYDQGQAGVRLSFALSYWLELGEAYPPALAKLKEIREETRERLEPEEGREIKFEDFHDLASINRELGDFEMTVAAFKLLDEEDPKMAARVYRVAQPALIRTKQYKLCGKYFETEASAKQVVERFNRMKEASKRVGMAQQLLEHASKQYINDAATLVAILAVNDRLEDAADAVAILRHAEGDEAFQKQLATALDDALDGVVPEPWP